MTPLPQGFFDRPIAHRGLHGPDLPENSLSAVRAAVAAGYGVEIDLQPSADGLAMVFHDHSLERMTGEPGLIARRTSAELGDMILRNRAGQGLSDDVIPTLQAVLDAVAGHVPLLVEIKDQDGALGPEVGGLERATAHALTGYDGPVAVMSFNPYSVAMMADLATGHHSGPHDG